jgi:FAD/FMN-containing dehydrogenase
VPSFNPPSDATLRRLADIVGEQNALCDPARQAPYLTEWRDLYHGSTPIVLRPGSTEEVSRIMAIAHAERIGVVPQAGNTGLVGGQIPTGPEIVLSVDRMTRIREVDRQRTSMTVEAGVILADAHAEAEKHDRIFPLSMASQGSCRIGGNLATNAGGVQVLAYGNARALTLGLEAVLPDGRIWNGLTNLKKDNTGYDLRDLMIGSEGTLGIITAAVLKLFPRPHEQVTAFAGLPDLDAALVFLRLAQEHAGPALTAFEFMPAIAIDMVVMHIPGMQNPLAGRSPWYALLELSSPRAEGGMNDALDALLASASEKNLITDATIATSLDKSRALWKLRESISEAQKREGGSIKHDVSVPITTIPEFIRRANAIVEKICPGARPVPFGHMGDGNVHYNVSQPQGMSRAAFLALWETMNVAVHDLVVSLEGSISAEHGIGRLKRAELARLKPALELELMRRIKAVIDPLGIMNPGKVL